MTSSKRTRMEGRFRLRTILLIVNITVLLLPLFGLVFFRLYESELVRQTEMELISQAAVISTLYKQTIASELDNTDTYGREVPLENRHKIDEYYTPVSPVIRLSETRILPPRPDGVLVEQTTDFPVSEVQAQLSSFIKDVRKTTLSGIKILDYNGIVVAGSEVGRDFSKLAEISRAMSGQYHAVLRERISDEPPPALASISRGTNIRLFIAFPIIENDRIWGVVYISRTPQNILKHLYEVKESVFVAFIFILALTLLIAAFTSYTISKPIYRLISQIKSFAKGNEEVMVPLQDPVIKEIELLSKSFTQMANSLQERTGYIRDFATHVSHEFKTPLTSIQGAAELLEEHGHTMSAEEKNKFFRNITDNCQRLKILVGRLLELARADNLEATLETTSFNDILEKLVPYYNDLGLDFTLNKPENGCIIMSKDYLETIFANLFENSLQHGASKVSISAMEKESMLWVRVQDNGHGVSAKNRDKIFMPFFTTRRDQGGTGIGLGIIKSLLQAHQGNIKLLNSDEGACFELVLPLQSSLRRS